MPDQPARRRRRRGGRGGQNRPPEGQPPSAAPQPSPGPPARTPRQDSRRATRGERPRTPPGPPGPPAGGGRVQRAPSAAEPRREARGPRDGRSTREGRPRTMEAPVPQDEHSLELGARFKEAQAALRDARKALDKRKAEFSDEPEWMVEQLQQAEQHFTEIATEWAEHLAKTGRKVVRR